MSNADLIRSFEQQGIWAFERGGQVLRTVSMNDDDCRRDGVEAWIDGKWSMIVVASLDWERELPAALEAIKRGEPPIPRCTPQAPHLPSISDIRSSESALKPAVHEFDEGPSSLATREHEEILAGAHTQSFADRASSVLVVAEHPEI